MVKYSYEPDSASEIAKARGRALRVHFKHTREVVHTIKGMKLSKAKQFLEDVLEFKQAVPFTMFTGGIGRHAQLKNLKAPGSKGRWPQKASKMVLGLLENAEANAEKNGIETDELYVQHAQANRAQQQRRRTYRAHGRINPYMSHPAHVEIILGKSGKPVKKAKEEKPQRLTRKRQAQHRVKVGGGAEA